MIHFSSGDGGGWDGDLVDSVAEVDQVLRSDGSWEEHLPRTRVVVGELEVGCGVEGVAVTIIARGCGGGCG